MTDSFHDEAGPVSLPEGWRVPLEQYMAHLELEKGLAGNSTSGYSTDLYQAALYFWRELGVVGWTRLDPDQLSLWIGKLTSEEYAISSLARKISALRGLGKFLVKEKIRPDDLGEWLSSPRLTRKIPGTLSPDEVSRLLAAPKGEEPRQLRDRAMLELLYASGLRVTELCTITLQQLHLEEQFLRVWGKGSKERLVPFGKLAREAVEQFLERGRPALVKPRTGSALFLSQQGKPLSRKMFWVLLKQYSHTAGIERPVKPHLLRHSFASHLLRGGADLRVIQDLLGHADIGTTQIYTHLQNQDLADEVALHHPRNRSRPSNPKGSES